MHQKIKKIIETGSSSTDECTRHSVDDAVVCLTTFARQQKGLAVDGAWRLAPHEATALNSFAGFSPPGGWVALAGLAAGCGYLRATRDAFVMEDAPTDTSPVDVSRRLVESMTRRLVPPQAAASLFIALGIHPAWGLRLAYHVHQESRAPDWSLSSRPFPALPERHLPPLRKMVFELLAAITAGLRQLPRSCSFCLDMFCEFCGDVVEAVRTRADIEVDAAIPLFVADTPRCGRVTDIFACDLVDAVFVPAGVMRVRDDRRFEVFADGLEQVRVGRLGPAKQDRLLDALFGDSPVDRGGDDEPPAKRLQLVE